MRSSVCLEEDGCGIERVRTPRKGRGLKTPRRIWEQVRLPGLFRDRVETELVRGKQEEQVFEALPCAPLCWLFLHFCSQRCSSSPVTQTAQESTGLVESWVTPT